SQHGRQIPKRCSTLPIVAAAYGLPRWPAAVLFPDRSSVLLGIRRNNSPGGGVSATSRIFPPAGICSNAPETPMTLLDAPSFNAAGARKRRNIIIGLLVLLAVVGI